MIFGSLKITIKNIKKIKNLYIKNEITRYNKHIRFFRCVRLDGVDVTMKKVEGYQCQKCGQIFKMDHEQCPSCQWPYKSGKAYVFEDVGNILDKTFKGK